MIQIAYVFTSAGKVAGSVQTKVMNQISALNEIGVKCKGVFFTNEDVSNSENTNIEFVKVDKVTNAWFRSVRQKAIYHQAILQYFKDQTHFDFIYCRYPGASRNLFKWTRSNRSKVFFEHVTAELFEIKLNSKDHPLRLKLSNLLSRIEFYYLPAFQEMYYGKKIRKNALFGICNSSNIAEYENKVGGSSYIQIINGDSVNTQAFNLKKGFPDDEEFKMVFLKGASTNADFNGLDRVFEGLANYKGNAKIKFYLYGKNLQNEKLMIDRLKINDKVITGEYIDKTEIDRLVEEMNLGISALAVHRKGLKETTTIKSREYFARGLPFIYGHRDPDLSDRSELKNMCLELAGNDQPIDFEEVIKWYDQIDKANVSEQMRDFAMKNLDYKVKLKRIVNKLEE